MTSALPRIEWPNGARIAIVLQVPFEQFERGAAFANHLCSIPTLPEERISAGETDLLFNSWQQYSEVGMWRLTQLLDDHAVSATAVCNGIAIERYPEVMRKFLGGSGQREICAHSYAQDIKTYTLNSAEMRSNVKRCVQIISDFAGTPPVGWVSPGGQFRADTAAILAEEGFLYHGDYAHGDVPFTIDLGNSRRMVGMSVPWDANDVMHNSTGASPSQYVEIFCRSFDVLYREGGQILGAVAHAGTYGRPFGIWAYDQVIQYVKRFPDVWFATRKEIAQWYVSKYF
jgi:peptidoglycan/xylan/chitin deacetylase (PgdA/CDA1 family)